MSAELPAVALRRVVDHWRTMGAGLEFNGVIEKAARSLTTPGPDDWGVYAYARGFVVLRGDKGEALVNDGSGEVAYDATRKDCFFLTREAAQAAIAKATGGAA